MTFDPDRVTTLTFDSYSTLVDVDAVETALADHPSVGNPTPIATTWRTRSMQYTLVGNQIATYKPFYDVIRDALEYALAVHDIETTADERETILAAYHDLTVFDDVRDGLERLQEGGYDCYVLSNGNPEMLASMVDTAAIGDLLADTISAHELAAFKPDPDLYRHAAGRTGTPIEQIAHVSALSFDVQGAIHAGMQGVWLDRTGTPWDPFGDEPDLTIEAIDELADRLGC